MQRESKDQSRLSLKRLQNRAFDLTTAEFAFATINNIVRLQLYYPIDITYSTRDYTGNPRKNDLSGYNDIPRGDQLAVTMIP